MKIKKSTKWEDSFKAWTRWFAWRPVVIEGKWVWWEWIERKRDGVTSGYGNETWWNYRYEPNTQNPKLPLS